MQKSITLMLIVGSMLLVVSLSSIHCSVSSDEDDASSPCILTKSFNGVTNKDYTLVLYSPHSKEDKVQYRLDWGDNGLSNWSFMYNADEHASLTHRWVKPGVYAVYAQYRTMDGKISAWSNPVIIVIDSDMDMDGWSDKEEIFYGTSINNDKSCPPDNDGDYVSDLLDKDDDNDGLEDHLESALGSDPWNKGDVWGILIDGSFYYLVDVDEDGLIDILYNPVGVIRPVERMQDGSPLIDVKGDGRVVYIYDMTKDELRVYKNSTDNNSVPWLWVILLIIVVVVILLYVLVKTGFIYIYEEEVES